MSRPARAAALPEVQLPRARSSAGAARPARCFSNACVPAWAPKACSSVSSGGNSPSGLPVVLPSHPSSFQECACNLCSWLRHQTIDGHDVSGCLHTRFVVHTAYKPAGEEQRKTVCARRPNNVRFSHKCYCSRRESSVTCMVFRLQLPEPDSRQQLLPADSHALLGASARILQRCPPAPPQQGCQRFM